MGSPAHLQGANQGTFKGRRAALIGSVLTGWLIDPKKRKKEFLLDAKVLDPRKRFLDPLQLLNLIRVRPVLTYKWCYFAHTI